MRSTNLDPAFFNVPGAEYNVVKVSNGTWRIERTDASGKVESTKTFKYNVDYAYSWVCADENDSFEVVHNAQTNGVQITEVKVLYKRKATMDDKVR